MDSAHPQIRNSATLNEIMSQPAAWQKTLQDCASSAVIENILNQTHFRTAWLFVGCGTSYYLAEAAAASWSLQSGQRAFAVPASEVMLFPDASLLRLPGLQAVIISRSGQTSEALIACDLFRSKYKVPTLGITCTAGAPLEGASDLCLVVRSADEQSTVMTRSFTSMLLSLQHLAARLSGDAGFSTSLNSMAIHCASVIGSLAERVEEFVEKHTFSNYVFLGQGPFFGIAREGALKVTEMSCSHGQAYHTLEFRHGPKATVTPDTCLTFLLSQSGNDAERKVLTDMKQLGGTIIAVCNRANTEIRRDSDLVFELGAEIPEAAMLAPFVIPSQLLGFYTGIKKGLMPDCPRNLSRVVILD
jgi:glucosamine--fructose-6-phosphate aminotransferase (isomerizing)